MILGVVGFSNSGKTTFIGRMIDILRDKGLSVCTIKHVHDDASLCPEDKDTTRHLQAGASIAVGLSQQDMVAYFSGDFTLEAGIDLLKVLESPDVILVEGFKGSPIPKVVLGNAEAENVVGRGDEEGLIEIALSYILAEVDIETTMGKLAGLNCGKCGHPDCRGMAKAIVEGKAQVADCKALGSRTSIELDGKAIGVNSFVGEVVGNAVEGIVRALKGSGEPKEIVIRVKPNRPS